MLGFFLLHSTPLIRFTFFCHQRFCGFRCDAVLWRPFWWRALWLWVNFKYFHWTCSMNTYFLSSWDMTDGERKLSTYQFRKPCSQLKKSDFVTDSSLTPAYPCNTPTWNWKLLRGQLWKWLNTINYQLLTPVWMNVEYSRILAIEDVQRVLSSTTVRMVAKYLRIPETSWEERRMGWIGLRNPPEWFWRVDSFHSCWATRFAIELVEAWDLLGCWDTLISI